MSNEPKKPAKLSVPSWLDSPRARRAVAAFSKQPKRTHAERLAQLHRTHGTKPSGKP